MAFEQGLEHLERAAALLQVSNGSSRERLTAAIAELETLGYEAAVPAGILTEFVDFRTRLGSPEAVQELTDAECEREAARITGWTDRLREVVANGATGDSGPRTQSRQFSLTTSGDWTTASSDESAL